MPENNAKYATLVQVYKESVERYAGRPLFGTKRDGSWQWMTYGEFGHKVNQVRGGLAGLGVGRGDRVAVISNNRPEWAIGCYATYGLAAAYVPMYESQLDKEWKYILADCGAKVLFVPNADIRDRVAKFRAELPELVQIVVFEDSASDHAISFDELCRRGKERPTEIVDPDPSDIADYIYTSGTTGNPKGVLLTHANLASNISAIHEIFPVSADDRSLSFLPWAHSFGQTSELHALFSMGASLGIAESVEKIVDNLGEVKPTLLFSVPRIFNRIYDGLQKRMATEGGAKKKLFEAGLANANERRRLEEQGRKSAVVELKHKFFDKIVFSKVRERFGGNLKYAFSGGAAISREVAEFIDNLGIMVYEGYGLTETSPIATANWPGSRKIGSIGKAIPGVRIEVDTAATGDPKQGELIVYGPNVMKGYHNLPEENAKVFTADGGFRTGDMGCKDEQGFVYITGRVKEQYKLENGKYVVPTPLEEALKLSTFITNVMVYGDNKPYNVALIIPDMESLVGWAKQNGLDTSDPKKLLQEPKVRELYREEIAKHSSDFKQFEKIRDFSLAVEDFTIGNGMLTPSLKLKRRGVMERYGSQIESLYATRQEAQPAA